MQKNIFFSKLVFQYILRKTGKSFFDFKVSLVNVFVGLLLALEHLGIEVPPSVKQTKPWPESMIHEIVVL